LLSIVAIENGVVVIGGSGGEGGVDFRKEGEDAGGGDG